MSDERADIKTRFQKGNSYWQFRNKHGRGFAYTPDKLEEEFGKYVEWVQNNPLAEERLFSFQGAIVKGDATKARVMTLKAFCLFADITFQTFLNYKENPDFLDICTRIDEYTSTDRIELASANLIDAAFVARLDGIADNKNVKVNTEQPLFPDVSTDNSDK